MLTNHYQAPNSIMTVMQIAAAVGHESHGVTNLHYGMLGEKIADEHAWDVPRYDGVKMSTLARATGADADAPAVLANGTSSADWRWQMRPRLISAMAIWLGRKSKTPSG